MGGNQMKRRDPRDAILIAAAVALLVGIVIGVLLGREAGAEILPRTARSIMAPNPPLAVTVELDAYGAGPGLERLLTVVAAYNAEQARVARILEIGYRLNGCEQSGAWYVDGRAGNGQHVQGGLGMEADQLYPGLAGHSALADSPEQQIMVGYRAKIERGAAWGEHCAPIANEWLSVPR